MDISTVMTYLKELFATFLTLIMMLLPSFGTAAEPYTAEDPDALITSFAAVSDIHVETNQPAAYEHLKSVLEGIKAGENIDSVVYTGDNVMNGQLLENFFFYAAVRAVMPAENNLVLAGNHDLGNGEGDYQQFRENYIKNNKLYLGNDIGNDYYYRVINGCYMICLVSDDPTTQDFQMTRAQYDWLEGVLKEAQQADARIFVFNHYPLYYLDNNSEVDKAELGALMSAYNVALYVHGHIHDDLGTDNFYNSYGIRCINLPRITELTNYEAGDGIVVEVYEDKFVVRGRDFIKGEWLEELHYEYAF